MQGRREAGRAGGGQDAGQHLFGAGISGGSAAFQKVPDGRRGGVRRHQLRARVAFAEAGQGMKGQGQAVLPDGLLIGQGQDVVGPFQQGRGLRAPGADGLFPGRAVGFAFPQQAAQGLVACGRAQETRRVLDQAPGAVHVRIAFA